MVRLLPKRFWRGMLDATPDYRKTSEHEIVTMMQEAREWVGWAKEATQRRYGHSACDGEFDEIHRMMDKIIEMES